MIILPLFRKGIFDFKEIAEVGAEFQTQLNFLLFGAMVENSKVFHEAVAHKTATDNGKRGVFVDRAGGWDAEVLSVVILDGVRGQDIQSSAVDGQLPPRQVAHIFEKKTLRLIGPGVDIAIET